MAIRVGVIGMGLMGELHAQVYRSLPGVTLVGLAEVDAAKHEALRRQFGVPVYADPGELLDQVDAVSVCTPDHLHKEPILEAFRRGVKVLVEKPLGVSVEEAEQVLRARPDPSFLMVGHILRFDPRVIHCRRLIREGALGPLWYVKLWRHNSLNSGRKIGPRTSVTWFLGIHDVELLLWLTGRKAISVNAIGRKLFTPHWDVVHAHIKMEGGVLASVENSWILPVERASGLDAGIKIYGETGTAEINLTHSDVAVSTVRDGRQIQLDTYHWPTDGEVPYGDLRRQLEAFVRSVADNAVPPVTGEQGLEAVRVVERIEQSLETGREMSV